MLGVSRETRYLKGFMRPVMKEWLTTGLGMSLVRQNGVYVTIY